MSPYRSMQPTRDWRPPGGGCTYGDEQPPAVRRRLRPCLALLPAGVTWPRTLLRAPVVFYTTFSPLPPSCGAAVCFCGPFRQVHASRRFPRPGCYPTPCSMECGLSSTPTTQDRDRPTDLRHFHDTRIDLQRQIYLSYAFREKMPKIEVRASAPLFPGFPIFICVMPDLLMQHK